MILASRRALEVLPGLFRLGDRLGERFFYQYLFVGDKVLLVDTGVPSTPDETIFPALKEVGLEPSRLDFVLITHADVDHFGGNRSVKSRAMKALLVAHELDAPLIESKERIMNERYGWYKEFGINYPRETWEWLSKSAGTPTRLDIYISNPISVRLGASRVLKLLHLPGHTAGHLGVYDESTEGLVLGDSILGNGVSNTSMDLISPPPYFNVKDYVNTIKTVMDLKPKHIFASHYPRFSGKDVTKFLQESMKFVKKLEMSIIAALTENRGGMDLKQLFKIANLSAGPFKVNHNELAGSIKAHLEELESNKKVKRRIEGGKTQWFLIATNGV